MIFGKGIVKKYSREYKRTLKNGETKRYTTEQIQITVPKHEDIYENDEEVLIIPNDEIEDFTNLEEELKALQIANYLYIEEVKRLNEKIAESKDSSASQYQSEIEELKFKLDNKIRQLKEAEKKYEDLHASNIDDLKQENSNIKDKHSKLIIENENLKTKFVNIKTENENLKTKYSSIKEENKNLKTKCTTLKEEQSTIKASYDQVSSKYDQLKQENLNTKTSYAEMYELNEGLEKDYESLRLEYNELVDKYNALGEELHTLKTSKSHDEYIANKVKEFILKSRN